MTKMTTEEAFVKVLQKHGVEHAFGIIGSAFMPISDLFPSAGITFWAVAHESTGGQPTNTRNISISNIGKVTNFHVFEINDINYLKKNFKKIKKISGTIMIVIKINNSKIRSGRVTLDPVLIKNRFMESL